MEGGLALLSGFIDTEMEGAFGGGIGIGALSAAGSGCWGAGAA